MDPDPTFVMIPCTTDLRGSYKVPGQGGEPDTVAACRVHAIGFRDAAAKSAVKDNGTGEPGTWYLITIQYVEWAPNPIWVHESHPDLDLGF